MKSKNFKVDLESVQTNILMVYIKSDKFVAKDVIDRMNTVREDDEIKVHVRLISRDPKFVRITFYHEITDDDTEMVVKKIKLVVKEFDGKY